MEAQLEDSYFSRLFQAITEEERFHGEMIAAKGEFERVAGPIYDTDAGFHSRISAFHAWYVLDRPLNAKGHTPLAYFLEYNANSLPPDVLQGYRELEHHCHSVFELLKATPHEIRVRDLLSRKRYDVKGNEESRYLDRGAVFNARVFRHGNAYFLSDYIILHPHRTLKAIKQAAKRIVKSGADSKEFLLRLALYQSRWEQYRQMEVDKIYRFDL